MTSAEIEDVLDGFAQTARICVEAGLDGVELHGTHGYLLQQSFSPWGNRRDDEWGEQLAFAPGSDPRVRERDRPRARSSAFASRPTTSCPPSAAASASRRSATSPARSSTRASSTT